MPRSEGSPTSYESTGVRYDRMDPFKRMAQEAARSTSHNMERLGWQVVEESRGESAIVIDEGDRLTAHNIEGLGTKTLVADETRNLYKHIRRLKQANQTAIAFQMRSVTGDTYYKGIAKDNLAMIFNDINTVGGDPVLFHAYCAVGSSDWFKDEERAKDLVSGLAEGCNEAGVTWGGGETPTLTGIINPETIDLAGSAYGTIKFRGNLTLGEKLNPGDNILLVESSGIHANGLSLARRIASNIASETESTLSEAYASKLSDGSMYGEALLLPTHIYAGLIRDLFDEGVDINYMSNITGHGWRKLMRYANRPLTYRMHSVTQVQPVFDFIKQESGNDDREMYGNLNMGAGFAIYVRPEMANIVEEIAFKKHNLNVLNAGVVEEGPRQVIIESKNLIYTSDTLGVR